MELVYRDPIQERGGINLYGFARNNPVQFADTDGRWIISVLVGGGAIAVAVIVLPDWDAQNLNSAEAQKVNKLLDAIKSCAKDAEDPPMCKNLGALNPTGRFKKPSDNDDSAVTRNGRFFGYGNRTILPSKVDSMDDCTLANVLIHESYHAGTEDWTENKSYDYADEKLKKIKRCLEKKGFGPCP